MLVSDVLTRTTEALNDPTYERWTQASQIRYVNEAVLAVLAIRPDAYPVSGNLTLVAGSSQTLPPGALRLLDISHNVGGNIVTYLDREVMDRLMPSWRSATESLRIKHWMYENKVPKKFDVYPPAKLGAVLYGTWSAVPTALTALGDTLAIDDIYMTPVVEFVLYKCYLIDTEFSLQPNIAGTHMNMFSMLMGQKTSKDVAYSPDLNQKGGNPNISIAAGAV